MDINFYRTTLWCRRCERPLLWMYTHPILGYEPFWSLSYAASLRRSAAMLLSSLPWLSLFNLLVEGVLAQHRVKLLNFNTIGSILPILCRDISRRSRHARILMFCAFENDLYAVAFLGHLSRNWGANIMIPRELTRPSVKSNTSRWKSHANIGYNAWFPSLDLTIAHGQKENLSNHGTPCCPQPTKSGKTGSTCFHENTQNAS